MYTLGRCSTSPPLTHLSWYKLKKKKKRAAEVVGIAKSHLDRSCCHPTSRHLPCKIKSVPAQLTVQNVSWTAFRVARWPEAASPKKLAKT